MNKPFEIFSPINGHVFATIYGYENAKLNAQDLAQRRGVAVAIATYGCDDMEVFKPLKAHAFKQAESELTQIAKKEILECRKDAADFPEDTDEFRAQAFGVFRLWLMATYKKPDEENDEIRNMRELATNWKNHG